MLRGLVRSALIVGLLAYAAAAHGQLRDSTISLVDLELVLAVDVSSSVDGEEFDLQMKGLADAFRNPAVLDAIELAGERGIAVALVQWSSWNSQRLSVDWMRVRDPASAAAIADRIAAAPRFGDGGSTAIAGAIRFSTRQFEINDFEAERRAIDISGDGAANQGAQPSQYRDIAVASGLTINGLAILNDNAQLDDYYAGHVIGGNAAFVMRASDYRDFAEAILHKLVREIAGPPIAGRPPAPAQTAQQH
jgi:hypothetical protein